MAKRIPAQELDWLVELPIAHRGLHDRSKGVVENTMSAILAASDEGYAIECDVQLSGDGQAMVFHDKDLMRLCGVDGLVCDFTAAQLASIQNLDSNDTINTLPEILDALASHKNFVPPIIIELKKNQPHDAKLVVAVLNALQNYQGHAAVMSFGHEIVTQLSQAEHERPIGLVAQGDDSQLEKHLEGLSEETSFVSYDVNALPNKFCDQVKHDLDMKLITWTVRTPQQVEQTFAYADQMTFEGFGPHSL